VNPLNTFTTIINLIVLSASLWLGFYIITRSPHAIHSRLAAFALWFSDAYFLSNALWNNIKTDVMMAWMLQTTLMALPLMLHLSVVLIPFEVKRRTRLIVINKIGVPLSYIFAVVLIICGVLPSSPPVGLFNPGTEITPDPVQLGFVSRTASPFYPVFIIWFIGTCFLAFANMLRSYQRTRGTSLGQPFGTFFVAAGLVGLGGAYSGFGTWLKLDVPTFPADIFFGTAIFLVGYAVARYAALLEGRLMERDFFYALFLVGSFTLVYSLIAVALYASGQISFVALVFIIVGTIAANSLLDGARIALDRVFYQGQFQKLRGHLRALAREAGTSGTLNEQLQAILVSLCDFYRIQKGFIALKQDQQWLVRATYRAHAIGLAFENSALMATESIGLVHANKNNLTGMTLLVPLFASGAQIGAIVLGDKESKKPFAENDLELLEDLADQISALIHALQLQEQNAHAIDRMVEEFREKERALQLQTTKILEASREEIEPLGQGVQAETLVPWVEETLRKFYDFAYLGEHPLAKLRIVDQCLAERHEANAGFIERGKALGEILTRALEQLKPDTALPAKTQVPSREWHQYIILHDSYVSQEANRDIMSRLYISEGTFNRTRRRALYCVAKTLAEMGQAAIAK
jgi:hypothetical protein